MVEASILIRSKNEEKFLDDISLRRPDPMRL
jgi:hypothetical protein